MSSHGEAIVYLVGSLSTLANPQQIPVSGLEEGVNYSAVAAIQGGNGNPQPRAQYLPRSRGLIGTTLGTLHPGEALYVAREGDNK